MPKPPAHPTAIPWRALVTIPLSSAVILFLFRVGLGQFETVGIGVAAFFALVQLGFLVVPPLTTRARRDGKLGSVAGTPPLASSRLDALAVVWLLAIPFGPVIGWVATNSFAVTASNWRLLLGIRATVCILVPLLGALSMLRFVRGKTAGLAAAILGVGTVFPMFAGRAAAMDLMNGARWEQVVVEETIDVTHRGSRSTGRTFSVREAVQFTDGRTLLCGPDVAIAPGPMRVLVLRASNRVIGAMPVTE
jgi:hypothetical protein